MRGRKGKPLNSAEVVAMFETTPIREIATGFGVHHSRIRKILIDAGCDVHKWYRLGNPASLPVKKAKSPPKPDKPKQVAKLARRGLSDFEIAYQVGGVSSDQVREMRQGVGA